MPRKASTKEDSGGSTGSRSSDDDEPRPPRSKKVKDVRVEVSTARKGGKSTASSAARAKKTAAVKIAPPNVEILVRKPPSIWAARVRADPKSSGGKERKYEHAEALTTSEGKTTSESKASKGPESRKRAAAQGSSASKRRKPEAREEVSVRRTRKVSEVRSTTATRSTSSRTTSQRSSVQKLRRTAEDSSAEQDDDRAVTPEVPTQGASSSKRQKPRAREKASAKRTPRAPEARSTSVSRSTSSRKTAQRSLTEKRRKTAEVASSEQEDLGHSSSDNRAATPETEAVAPRTLEDSGEGAVPEVSDAAPQSTPLRSEYREQGAGERTETAVPESMQEYTPQLTPPRRKYREQSVGQHAETAVPEYRESIDIYTPQSTPPPDEFRSVAESLASWMACQCESCRKVHVSSGAVARVSMNSGKPTVHARSYAECQQLKDATNYIGMSLFNMLQAMESRNVCFSVYGLSFLVALFDRRAANAKGSLKQALKYGAMVPTSDGHIAYPCEEVVTTLRRRVAEDGEVKVNTEVYARNHSSTDRGFRPGKACSSRNVTSHIFTAELRTLTADGAHAVRDDVLFNTARFENLWRCSFDSHSTRRGDFFNNWNDRVTVAMMRRTSVRPYSFYPDLDTDVVCLPYADGAMCMTLLLQRSPSPSFPALTPDNLSGFVRGTRDRLVTVQLPKFRVHSSVEVGELLAGLARDLDDETRRLHFRHARQETRISVAEGDWHGGACAERPTFSGSPVTVVFNKPFYFAITDRTCDVILYVGRVMSL